ncbi:MAG: CDP-alcohol phosphatidyltransferase family protein [Acidobacteria bacterium]|nr:CDP-alcohol phosphatidyltransferase family protein [Acidobacteriota bacterium]
MTSAACSAAGIALIATVDPSALSALVVVGLLILGYGLDSADGQLARLRGGGSPGGEWLDHTVDAAKIVTLHLAILISLYRFGDLTSDVWLLVPIGFAATSTVLFFSWILRDYMLSNTSISTNRRSDGERFSVANSLMRTAEDYGVLMLVLLTLPVTKLFVGLYTVLFAWSVMMVVVSLPRRFHAIESSGREGAS